MLSLLKLFLLFLIINQVINKDILNIHWDVINPTNNNEHRYELITQNFRKIRKINKTQQHQIGHDYETIEHLESDFGTFIGDDNKNQRWPRLQIDDFNRNDVKKRINRLLKTYLARLYTQKYLQGDPNWLVAPSGLAVATTTTTAAPSSLEDYESKFVDGHLIFEKNATILAQFKNKTLNLINKFKQLFSLFTIIQFDHQVCQTTINNIIYMGVCYPAGVCEKLNGTTSGRCANGFGYCCVSRGTCGGSSNQNCTYFENPGYPNYDPNNNNTTVPPPVTTSTTMSPITGPTPDPRYKFYYRPFSRYRRQIDTQYSCTYRVLKTNANVKQMRIDFLDFELNGPINGTCSDERLIINGQNINDRIPAICGYNTGQHIYVDVTMLDGPLMLSVLSATGQPKRFRLRICQIVGETCTNSFNCLQQYTGITGVISSFNYDQSAIFNRSRPGYFNNLNYAICIRKEAGYCTITFTNIANNMVYPFQFVNVDENGQSTIPPNQAGVDIFNCPDDYIVIGGQRLCGDRFNDGTIIDDFMQNAPITDSSAGPIVVQVRTNQAITGRGFKLFYTQNRCPT